MDFAWTPEQEALRDQARKRELQLIHIAKGQLGLGDDAYRDLLGQVTGSDKVRTEELAARWEDLKSAYGGEPFAVAFREASYDTNLTARYTAGVDNRTGALVQFIATAVCSVLVARTFETCVVQWHPRFVFALGWLCIVLSLGAVSILWMLIKQGAASRVASLFYLVPPVVAVGLMTPTPTPRRPVLARS